MFSHYMLVCAVMLLLLDGMMCFNPVGRFVSRIRAMPQRMSADEPVATLEPMPGSPIVKNINKESNIASMSVAVPGEATDRAFAKSCDMFNEEVKTRGYKVSGFRQGAKLPAQYLFQMFGEDQVKDLCGRFLSEEIQDECEKTGLMFVGRGRIMNFRSNEFKPGQPHVIDIECDLWPEITYGSEGGAGYKGLSVTVIKDKDDEAKVDKVKMNIRERYKVLTDTAEGHAAVMGDVIVVNMKGYEKNPDGSKGAELPAIASGERVEIELETGKFMPGMVEKLIGCKAGEVKNMDITFPQRPSGPGAAMSGKEAVFEVTVLGVKTKTLPEWDEKLAASIRDGMDLAELESEVQKAVEGEASSSTENNRNEALAAALLDITTISQLPVSLVEENTQQRFQEMLMDFKKSGSTDEQLQEMMTEEKYLKYKELSKPNVEKIVKLGMAFRDIAEKESLQVTKEEVKEQYEGLKIQAKQKGEQAPDEIAASDEIEQVLQRKKVFSFLAEHAQIEYVDPPEQPV